MKLRLGFAVAAHLYPDILLIDEVLAVGDIEFQQKCFGVMEQLQKSNRTVILVSHNIAAIEKFCPRTIWIDNGQIQQDGRTREVINAYLSTYSKTENTNSDLSSILSRTGKGDVKFSALQFLSSNKQPKEFIQCGDNLTVRLHYHAVKRVLKPYFGLKILSNLGTLVTELNTWNTGYEIPVLNPGAGNIDLIIASLNLVPGRYDISLWISNYWEWFDVLNHCATIDVKDSDYFGSGRGFETDYDYGVTVFPCKWKLGQTH